MAHILGQGQWMNQQVAMPPRAAPALCTAPTNPTPLLNQRSPIKLRPCTPITVPSLIPTSWPHRSATSQPPTKCVVVHLLSGKVCAKMLLTAQNGGVPVVPTAHRLAQKTTVARVGSGGMYNLTFSRPTISSNIHVAYGASMYPIHAQTSPWHTLVFLPGPLDEDCLLHKQLWKRMKSARR